MFHFRRRIMKKVIAKSAWPCYNSLRVRTGQHIGMSPSGKAPDFDSGIRRFKSCHPSQLDPLAQLAEQLPFKQWVRSSNLRRVTTPSSIWMMGIFLSCGQKQAIFRPPNIFTIANCKYYCQGFSFHLLQNLCFVIRWLVYFV